MDDRPDLMACTADELVGLANRIGVHFFLPPITNRYFTAGRLMVWNHREPAGQCIVEAMRARRNEIASFLRDQRPPPLAVAVEEEQFRRQILRERDADIPLSEMTFGTLVSIVRIEVRQEVARWQAKYSHPGGIDSNVTCTGPQKRQPQAWRMRL